MHLNKWNTRWYFIFFDISKKLVAYKHTYFVQRNRMKCGHSRNLFYAFRSRFSFNLHTSVTQQNKSNTRWDFIFIRHLKTTCGWRRRPAGRQRWRRCPARCGRQSTRTTRCTDASGCSGPRTVNQCRGTISQVRELSYRPVTVLGCVSSSYVSVWISCYIAAYDLVVYVIFIVYMFWIHTCGI